jgi:hypothetical protein
MSSARDAPWMAVDWMAVAAAMASAAHGVGLGGYRAAKDRAVTSMRAAMEVPSYA